jgi:hypothetical protein
MRRFLVFACLPLALLLALAPSGSAASELALFSVRPFVGLWEGVDPVDGGDSLRSITCDRDGNCKLAATDSVITLCGSGPAFVGGTGTVEGAQLVFADAVLTCPDGRTVDLVIRFARDPLNRTLVETTTVGDRTLPNIVFHNISR